MPSSGLYSVIFGTPQGEIGGGIVVSHGGKVQGGDITYFYDGSVQEEGSRVIAHVLVQKYQQTGESVFGDIPRFRLRLSGTSDGSHILLKGSMVENPGAEITVQCTKLAV
jgi:hypothetical protein